MCQYADLKNSKLPYLHLSYFIKSIKNLMQAAVVLRAADDDEARPRHVGLVGSLCVPE